MNDNDQTTTVAITAAITGAVALLFSFVKSLFTRNVTAAERTLDKLEAGLAAILLELRTIHDQQANMRSDILLLNREAESTAKTVAAAHARLDALMKQLPGPK